jgi:hypothetical protein
MFLFRNRHTGKLEHGLMCERDPTAALGAVWKTRRRTVIKFTSTMALLAGATVMAGAGLAGCSSQDPVVVAGALQGSNGSIRLALEVGGQTISTVTAVIAGPKGFVTQTHSIDVSGTNGVISIYFGSLPVAEGYEIELTAGPCVGSADFDVNANETTLVNVQMLCGPDRSENSTGSVQITGTLSNAAPSECFHILKMVAAPSVQNGAAAPVSQVELVLNEWVNPTAIIWSTASTNGGAGTVGELAGNVDRKVTFDCTANGSVAVFANVTAPNETAPCTEQGRVTVTCGNGAPTLCGNGTIDTGEQCDGTNIPAGQPPGTTCNAQCQLVPPNNLCGNGQINPPEQCDGTNIPAGQPPGTTCNAQCQLVPPAGDGPCLACAKQNCATQYNDALGTASTPANLADVTQLFDCIIGPNFEQGNAIPQTSCYFADPAQPLGSLVPCYCGNTPQATCLATGPANNADACGLEVELASDCAPVTAACVTASGSLPTTPLGDALQLLNCERAACQAQCGFPPPIEE